MKTQRVTVLTTVSICVCFSLFLSSGLSRGQSIESLPWGEPIDGLQMSISVADSRKPDVPTYQVALRNVGERDVTLNLGFMLANGKAQLPESINLNLTDESGKTRKLKFFDRRYPGVAGRVDDYVVALRAGSIYTLILGLDQFWSPETNEFELKLRPGKYQITAQFEGGGAKSSNLDMPGIKLMNFWQGKLQSNALVVER